MLDYFLFDLYFTNIYLETFKTFKIQSVNHWVTRQRLLT